MHDADVHPQVTEHIEEIIYFIQVLVDNGFAYESDGDVYYRRQNLITESCQINRLMN